MTDDKDPRSGFDGKMSQSRFLDDCREVSYSMGLIVISSSTNSPEPGEPSFAVNVQPDFRALPSKPPLIYRTGIDPNLAYTEQPERELPYPVFSHPIRENWLTIGERLYRLLDTQGVRWSTIDPIRFKFPSKRPGPLHIWVGVEPDSLGFEKAKEVAAACKRMLAETGHEDIEMAFRESSYSSLAGPDFISLQSAVRDKDFMDNLRCPFAPCLGIAIAPRQTPHHEATGGIYLCEGGARNRLLLLTARHAVLPKTTHPNNTVFEQKPPGQRQNKQDIILLGTRAYANAVDSIMGHIGKHLKEVERQRADWDLLSPREKSEIAEVETLVERLTKFYNEATLGWASPTMRIIGQVLYAPPLAVVRVGERQHTEDWALVEINKAKLQSNEFCGNVMFLGIKTLSETTSFNDKMHPSIQSSSHFKFPRDGLFQIQGIATSREISQPDKLDRNGEPTLPVVKNGMSTGVTVGLATGLESFVRHCPGDISYEPSIEVAVYSADGETFSQAGDSGSIVVSGDGKIVGMITGGTGFGRGHKDTTYVTPFSFLMDRVKKVFPHAYLYPTVSK